MNDTTEYGETWVYESIVGALPGVNIGERGAIVLQIAVFEVGVLFFAWVYDLWTAAVAGTAAIVVAAVGSVVMLRMGEQTRAAAVPVPYRRLLFGSSIEVVLGVLAFVALVTHLFVFDPQQTETPLLTVLFGAEPPVIVVYLTLLVLWDLCYRIGTSWWAAVVNLWGAVRYRFDEPTARSVKRVNYLNVGFGVAQVLLVPFVLDQPVLLVAVGGHVVAVTVVSVAAALLTRT
ncbi:hypothetical protein E6P09_03600 [Haloferax mediterranei ATCC 33500]|uniref:Uncharacterized protein n=1 Tax=Haloferax mediterranei (strain ATCC 33500 / DSM 1411 / JCM 8866 / NBRC 14739 / NCIMB 2177 / R-4) TaxID=523841 RepID=I3R0T5_HALMT|nr:hypothetical protein [Haloferax mediterranei]AFK17845.1 hypothetical protein HFX_0103 [Haloferax mediterranei ATCC 33500]AHZ22731.1 hypothetical protein BM92_08765 [Haloferax mediterranei ATCC 33500]EMA02882.1 hypothetical protein C439_09875 [Haloferax mediterranei ATCC 33500]MDX5987933.1 hypothetical protein [Haloferax mediterranei ATCC 33500]QCQ74403.1 hypothetical protein E6P09_03600 [Haloferax mediterranei ATCC 33500]